MDFSNYVRFLRGTTQSYNQLDQKDPDTLYFISESLESNTGLLYLGNKLIGISTDTINLEDLANIEIEELKDKTLLVYDQRNNIWSPKTMEEIIIDSKIFISEMTGATQNQNGKSGLVPKPIAGQQELYLQGNATWSDPTLKVVGNASEDFNTLKKIEAKVLDLNLKQGDVEDLNKEYYVPTIEKQTTLINEINGINDRLTWKNFN